MDKDNLDPTLAQQLTELREPLNGFDRIIIEALVQRAKQAEKIGKLKKQHGLSILDKKREKEHLSDIQKLHREYDDSLLSDDELVVVFERVIAACRAVQERIEV